MSTLFPTKLKLRSFQELSPSPRVKTSGPAEVKVLDEGTAPAKAKTPDSWAQLPNKQWLRCVRDNRLGNEKRVFRVELYDESKTTRIAIFNRQTDRGRR